MGIFIKGLYIGSEDVKRERDGKVSYSCMIGVACGVDAYRVYLAEGEAVKLEGYSLGDEIEVKVRPFASRNGVGYWDGKII